MDGSVVKRLKALEDRVPADVVIIAETVKGEIVEARVKDVISEDGELKEGYIGIGEAEGRLVIKGNGLKDLDRLLTYFKAEAEKDAEGGDTDGE